MINWTPRLIEARDWVRSGHDAIGQTRKYEGTPYWEHVERVAENVSNYTQDEDIIIAALGHDIEEDVAPKLPDHYSLSIIRVKYGVRVASFVDDLTDKFTKEAYPKLNRKQRKQLEAERLESIQKESQLIKVCDLIDNSDSIVKHDEGFARTYLPEKLVALGSLAGNVPDALFNRAMNQVLDGYAKLGMTLPMLSSPA